MNEDKKISELPLAANLALDDLLAVVHEGVTSKISLRALISEMQFQIPQPRIKIKRDFANEHYGHDQVYASWEGSDEKFLKFGPKFFLYRYKKAELRTFLNKKTENRDAVFMKKRFVHPSHQHGADYFRTSGSVVSGARYFDGGQFATIRGLTQSIPSRNTEWDVSTHPFDETHLDLGPWSYYRTEGMTNPHLGLEPDDFPMEKQPWPRGTGTMKSRLQVFKVRIAIDNPDLNSDQPKLFGPFSETFVLYPHKDGSLWTSLRYFLGPEASPKLRGKL